MGWLTLIIFLAIVGLIVGAFARLALPGKDPMSIPMTIGIGLAGSFIGGFIGRAVFDQDGFSILLAIICAALIVYLVRRSRGGGLTDPGAPRG